MVWDEIKDTRGFEGAEAGAILENLMVIDDEPESSQALKQLLENSGYRVTIVKDGGQAHGTWRMRKPDFVVLSIILPGETGFEICERIKQMDEYVPVVFVTKIDLDAARHLAENVGADGYAVQPYDPDKLVKFIREVARRVSIKSERKGDRHIGRIRFRCRCGEVLKAELANKGKSMRCPACNELTIIPQSSDQTGFLQLRSAVDSSEPVKQAEPMKFVTVKCQHCSTFYRLFEGQEAKARTCPKCGKNQRGTLSIVGAPISRAALSSSGRVLRILSGKNKGKKLLLPNKEVVLGSEKGCEFRNTAHGVSKRHCSLKPTTHGLLIRDLGGETGTRINGKTIEEETLLSPGDRLQVGTMRFELLGREREEETRERTRESEKERIARERGIKIYSQKKSTAAEAASVIEEYWDQQRERSQ